MGWEQCSAPCGTGRQSRKRQITVVPMDGGKACPVLSQKRKCNEHKCKCKAMTCDYREHEGYPGVKTVHVTHGVGFTKSGKAMGLAQDYFTRDGIHHCKYDRVTKSCECTCPSMTSESYTTHLGHNLGKWKPTNHN